VLWSYPVKVALQAVFDRRPTRHFARGFLACYMLVTSIEMMLWESLLSECWYDTALYALVWPVYKIAVALRIEMIQDWVVAFTSCGG
jgi:hypothetical protein